MEKAYQFSALVEKLKVHGLEVAEETAKALTVSVLEWVKESAVLSENKVDDVLAVLIPLIEKPILDLEDKINPEG